MIALPQFDEYLRASLDAVNLRLPRNLPAKEPRRGSHCAGQIYLAASFAAPHLAACPADLSAAYFEGDVDETLQSFTPRPMASLSFSIYLQFEEEEFELGLAPIPFSFEVLHLMRVSSAATSSPSPSLESNCKAGTWRIACMIVARELGICSRTRCHLDLGSLRRPSRS